MSQSINEVWSRELAGPPREAEVEPIEMTFDGLPCKVRPLPLDFYIRSGRMPDYLTRIALSDSTAEAIETEFARITAESYLKSRNLQREVVCRALVEPRVVDVPPGEKPEGSFGYMELAERHPKFVDAIFSWFLLGCPVPVKGGEGEGLDAETLANFPEKPERGKRAGGGNRSARKRKATVRANAADQRPPAQA